MTRCPVIINENNIEHEHPSVFQFEMPTSISNSEDQSEKMKFKRPDQYKIEKPKPSYYWAIKHQFHSE